MKRSERRFDVLAVGCSRTWPSWPSWGERGRTILVRPGFVVPQEDVKGSEWRVPSFRLCAGGRVHGPASTSELYLRALPPNSTSELCRTGALGTLGPAGSLSLYWGRAEQRWGLARRSNEGMDAERNAPPRHLTVRELAPVTYYVPVRPPTLSGPVISLPLLT